MKLAEELLTHKYRPSRIQAAVLPQDYKDQFQSFINNNNIPNLLFSGIQGSGKTTIAKILINTLDCEFLEFNGSNGELNIDALREQLEDFTSCVSLSGAKMKVVFIDEADGLNTIVQRGLRNFMEKHSDVRFILTVNYPEKLIAAIHSRCATFDFNIPKNKINLLAKEFAVLCTKILQAEMVEYNSDDIISLVKLHYPDQRRILNEIQKNIRGKKLQKIEQHHTNVTEVFELFKPTKLDYNKLKSWVKECYIDSVYSDLFASAEDNLIGDELASFIVNLAQAQRYDSCVPNRELNLIGALLDFKYDN